MKYPEFITAFININDVKIREEVILSLKKRFTVLKLHILDDKDLKECSCPPEEFTKIDIIISDTIIDPHLINTYCIPILVVIFPSQLEDMIKETETLGGPIYHAYDLFPNNVIDSDLFKERIASLICKKRCIQNKISIAADLWRAIDYSNLYVIITNKEGVIIAVSIKLAKDLQGGSPNTYTIVGKNIYDFMYEDDVERIKNTNKKLIDGCEANIEVAFRMKTKTENLLPIKWITSFINTDLNWIFKVGVAVSTNINYEEADMIREYYTNLVKKDREKIDKSKAETEKMLGGRGGNVTNL